LRWLICWCSSCDQGRSSLPGMGPPMEPPTGRCVIAQRPVFGVHLCLLFGLRARRVKLQVIVAPMEMEIRASCRAASPHHSKRKPYEMRSFGMVRLPEWAKWEHQRLSRPAPRAAATTRWGAFCAERAVAHRNWVITTRREGRSRMAITDGDHGWRCGGKVDWLRRGRVSKGEILFDHRECHVDLRHGEDAGAGRWRRRHRTRQAQIASRAATQAHDGHDSANGLR
jgi:hypothetical protein